MNSFVPDFIINPVLRQARRLSSNFTSSDPKPPLAPQPGHVTPLCRGHAVSVPEQTLKDSTILRTTTSALSSPASSPTGEPRPAEVPSTLTGTKPNILSPQVALSTMEPRDGETPAGSQGSGAEQNIQNPLPSAFYGNVELPEDDGMGDLRRRILAVQAKDTASIEKARLMHVILMEGYTRYRQASLPLIPASPSSPAAKPSATIQEELPYASPLETLKFWHASLSNAHPAVSQTFTLSEEDLRPTYVPVDSVPAADSQVDGAETGVEEEEHHLGCAHYRRNVKMQCFTCERWYTCRLCHDEAEDHVLPRRDTKNMLCMLCGHAQRVGDICAKCGEFAARYYCNICKLWDDAPEKRIYHCNDCGLCRVGEGLGKDFFHCKKCGSCIAINQEESHRCREGVMDCDCPICGEYMFTSHKKVVTMKCGHTIHDSCRAQYIKGSYKCPICNKSVENMESTFRRLDKHLEEQPMPEEYMYTRAVILCNDCESKTTTKYHWGGLRCEICLSYNTVELHLINSPKSHGSDSEQPAEVADSDKTAASSTLLPETGSLRPGQPLSITAVRDSLLTPGYPGSPLSASSPSVRLFRSVSPALMAAPAPTTAPVMAMPPPGYGRDGFQPEDDDNVSDCEDEDILGLWRLNRLSFMSGGSKDDGEDDDGSEDDDDDDDEDNFDDDDADDDDDEEEIALFGHP